MPPPWRRRSTPASRPPRARRRWCWWKSSDWTAALAASALASAPLGAPLLYADGERLPGATSSALRALHPLGAKALGGAQVIRDRDLGPPARRAPRPRRARRRRTGGRRGRRRARAGRHRRPLPPGDRAPRRRPARAWNARGRPGGRERRSDPVRHGRRRSGADGERALAPAPAGHLRRRPLCRAARHDRRARALRPRHADPQQAPRRPIRAVPRTMPSPSRASPTVRSAGGSKNPATASCSRTPGSPFDAPASALLSATGDYAPLLLLEDAEAVPPALARYLGDIQPAYGAAPQFAAGARRVQSRLADRRRTSDLAADAGRTRLHARDRPTPHLIRRRSSSSSE